MSDTITVRVRTFAGLREALGFKERELTLPAGSDVTAALAELGLSHPAADLARRRFTVAVNRNYARPDRLLADGDELALFPPVSGGAVKLFEIVTRPISLDEVAGRVAGPEYGAITCFAGTVRGVTYSGQPGAAASAQPPAAASAQGVSSPAANGRPRLTDYLEYEAYPEMAEAVLAQIGAEVQARWPSVAAVSIVHRVGRLEVGDISVVIAVAAGHRRDTFAACQYAIDRIKEIAPIWKREVGPDGAFWVEGPEAGA